MEKNKTYYVWRVKTVDSKWNQILSKGRLRDCKNVLKNLEVGYKEHGWKTISTDRTLLTIAPQEETIENVYIITEYVNGMNVKEE